MFWCMLVFILWFLLSTTWKTWRFLGHRCFEMCFPSAVQWRGSPRRDPAGSSWCPPSLQQPHGGRRWWDPPLIQMCCLASVLFAGCFFFFFFFFTSLHLNDPWKGKMVTTSSVLSCFNRCTLTFNGFIKKRLGLLPQSFHFQKCLRDSTQPVSSSAFASETLFLL